MGGSLIDYVYVAVDVVAWHIQGPNYSMHFGSLINLADQ